MRERIDAEQALEERPTIRHQKMAVNLRVGEALVLHPECGSLILIELVDKHGYGARIEVRAPPSVKITPPA